MQGTWEQLKPALLDSSRNVVSRAALYALPYMDQCRLAYDPQTPASVVSALKYSPDKSAVHAAFQREAVLAGKLTSPFGPI